MAPCSMTKYSFSATALFQSVSWMSLRRAGWPAVEAVLAFSGAEDPMVDDRLLFLQVLEKEAHIGHPQRRPLGVSVEDDVLDLFSAKPLLPLAPQHPEDGVDRCCFFRCRWARRSP